MSNISRRDLVRGLAAGAVVLGFDPSSRSWVTEADASPCGGGGLPSLDGELATDAASCAAAAEDFGHFIHRTPVAVLRPGSVNDIKKMVSFANAQGIRIACRGQGHTTYGQAQANAGLVIDMSTLDTIHSIGAARAVVDAGVVWRDLIVATTAQGLTPPVLTDYSALSIGGTLSVGGVNGTSHLHGAQVDNVIELQVVTGEGDLLTCSRTHRRNLFEAALGGLGLCAISVRATLRLVAAKANARTRRLFYPDVLSMLDDVRFLAFEERFDHVRGMGVPTPEGPIGFFVEATIFSNPGDDDDTDEDELLSGLSFIPGSQQVEDRSYFDFTDIVYQQTQLLKQFGLWGLPHPWLDLFVPDSSTDTFIPQVVASIEPATFLPGSLLLFYPLRGEALTRPLLRVPNDDYFVLFDVLRTAPPDPAVISALLQQNRAFYDLNVANGGTAYTISAVPLSPVDWKRHFKPHWGQLVSAKNQFDPDRVLGAGINVL